MKSKRVVPTLLFFAAVVVLAIVLWPRIPSIFGGVVASSSQAGESEVLSDAEIAEALDRLAKIYMVPSDPNPIVARIANAEQLTVQQPFYENVQDGDYVYIFPDEVKAVIMRPKGSSGIIINMGPVQVEPGAVTQGTLPVATEAASEQMTITEEVVVPIEVPTQDVPDPEGEAEGQ